MNSKEKSLKAREEGETTTTEWIPKSSASSSRSWSASRNPRIVRVSRAFGGKDRHSKVCTIRGLRDRRIRLSVPTAIQLYDLQDRLGVNQPSKVIDWLLTVTTLDINKLPPLQLPPGFGQFGRELLTSQDHSEIRPKSKQMQRGENLAKEKWIKTREDDEDDDEEQVHRAIRDYNNQISGQKLLQSANVSCLPSLAYDNCYYSDQPSCLSLSQFGNHGIFQPQMEITQTAHNSQQIPPLLSASSSQLFLCQPSVPPAALFTPFSYISTPLESSDTARLYSNIQMLNSTHLFSSPVKFFPPNVSPKLANSENKNSPEKDDPR